MTGHRPFDLNFAPLVHGATVVREDLVLVNDDVLHQFVHVTLEDNLIQFFGHGHESRTEADGQVVRVHHVFVAELRQAEKHSGRISYCIYLILMKIKFFKYLNVTDWLRKAKRNLMRTKTGLDSDVTNKC